ncbi:MAG TPA: response regulator transcription factor, partial [Phycicoccus sp.]|nr:response regulator transcription factor [Phycicoccus sp.]
MTQPHAQPGRSAGGGARHTPIRVVLVDDHRMFRTGVRSELADQAGDLIEIVGEAPDVESAVSVIKSEQPDVVLLDVHLPGGTGQGGVDVLRGCVAQESL